jgi:hypothetical protein
MTQEYTIANAPSAVRAASQVPAELSGKDIDALREKVRLGRAFLKVVAYPWGVEFEVCEAGVP